MTFCQIFEVASRVRQKVIDHRSLTIEKCSVQEKKVIGDKRSLMTESLMTGSTVLPGQLGIGSIEYYNLLCFWGSFGAGEGIFMVDEKTCLMRNDTIAE